MSVEQRSPRPTDSLFFALFPDASATERIENIAQQLCADHHVTGKPLATQRLHVSLHHLGNFRGLPPEAVAIAEQAATVVSMRPFELAFDHVISFKSKNADNKPLVLGIRDKPPALEVLYETLGAALKKTEFGRNIKSTLTPHLTLLYGNHQITQDIEPITWTVREFVLVHSLLGRTKYIVLGRWPLCD